MTKTQIIMVNKEVCCRDNRLHTIYDEREVTVCVPVICKELRTITKCVTENVEEEQEVTVCVPVMTREKRVAKINVCKTVTEEVEMEVCVPVTTYTEKEVCSRVQIPSACGDASGCTYATQVRGAPTPAHRTTDLASSFSYFSSTSSPSRSLLYRHRRPRIPCAPVDHHDQGALHDDGEADQEGARVQADHRGGGQGVRGVRQHHQAGACVCPNPS